MKNERIQKYYEGYMTDDERRGEGADNQLEAAKEQLVSWLLKCGEYTIENMQEAGIDEEIRYKVIEAMLEAHSNGFEEGFKEASELLNNYHDESKEDREKRYQRKAEDKLRTYSGNKHRVEEFKTIAKEIRKDLTKADSLRDLEIAISLLQAENKTIENAIKFFEKDPYIEAIRLKYCEELAEEEIADRMSCDTSTVWRNRNRIIKKMAILFFGYEPYM